MKNCHLRQFCRDTIHILEVKSKYNNDNTTFLHDNVYHEFDCFHCKPCNQKSFLPQRFVTNLYLTHFP